jgi:diadenosine tetraphosphate (Ap4A) HIT family hydrolase
MSDFALDPNLAANAIVLGDLGLSRLIAMNDANYPWLILVPRRPDLTELTDLPRAERIRLMDEIAEVSDALAAVTRPHKLNVAAIGNRVRQLHIHVVARFEGDPAWPDPIWGKHPMRAFSSEAAEAFTDSIKAALADALKPVPAVHKAPQGE